MTFSRSARFWGSTRTADNSNGFNGHTQNNRVICNGLHCLKRKWTFAFWNASGHWAMCPHEKWTRKVMSTSALLLEHFRLKFTTQIIDDMTRKISEQIPSWARELLLLQEEYDSAARAVASASLSASLRKKGKSEN